MINKKSPKIKLSDDFYKDFLLEQLSEKLKIHKNFISKNKSTMEPLLFKYLTVGQDF